MQHVDVRHGQDAEQSQICTSVLPGIPQGPQALIVNEHSVLEFYRKISGAI